MLSIEDVARMRSSDRDQQRSSSAWEERCLIHREVFEEFGHAVAAQRMVAFRIPSVPLSGTGERDEELPALVIVEDEFARVEIALALEAFADDVTRARILVEELVGSEEPSHSGIPRVRTSRLDREAERVERRLETDEHVTRT